MRLDLSSLGDSDRRRYLNIRPRKNQQMKSAIPLEQVHAPLSPNRIAVWTLPAPTIVRELILAAASGNSGLEARARWAPQCDLIPPSYWLCRCWRTMVAGKAGYGRPEIGVSGDFV